MKENENKKKNPLNSSELFRTIEICEQTIPKSRDFKTSEKGHQKIKRPDGKNKENFCQTIETKRKNNNNSRTKTLFHYINLWFPILFWFFSSVNEKKHEKLFEILLLL